MFKLTRLLKNLLNAFAQELESDSLNEVMSVTNYRDVAYEATVTQAIMPGGIGQVKFKGTWWNARCSRDVALMPNQTVYVMDRQGNTLYVEPGFMLRVMLPMLTTLPRPNELSL
ncbi:MAG: NfeD family protein [Stenomitos rutilans HA7619-LM2]|jgi:membrane protein implicated in regulation of membrane protease activity|nr:NfeD family protein [Stenomitos rutilans HA7619-LM2]